MGIEVANCKKSICLIFSLYHHVFDYVVSLCQKLKIFSFSWFFFQILSWFCMEIATASQKNVCKVSCWIWHYSLHLSPTLILKFLLQIISFYSSMRKFFRIYSRFLSSTWYGEKSLLKNCLPTENDDITLNFSMQTFIVCYYKYNKWYPILTNQKVKNYGALISNIFFYI